MTGQEALLAMRRARRVPRAVWVTDGDDKMARDWQDHVNPYDEQRHARIAIAETDIPETLDLRCLVGLEVHVSAERTPARAKRIHDAIVAAGARMVITTHDELELLEHGTRNG